jgi:tRNA threonylcarbamoyladenosine biosynthesis protein TsaE
VTKVQQIIHRLPKSLHMGYLRSEVQTPNECQVPATPVSDTISVLDVVTGSPEETEALAARLATRLRVGDVVAVSGELGAGKTTFVRGAARALGVHEPVSSPTFTIGHRYEAPVPVAHLDLYRLAGIDPEEWGDLEPYFDGTVAFVEWPEHGGHWLPETRATVTLNHVDESHRQVSIDSEDDLGL